VRQKEIILKAIAACGFISISVFFFLFVLSVSDQAVAHEGHGTAEQILFTKHFEKTLFDVTEHGTFSIEVLPDDKEYEIGKAMTGIIVHDTKDSDVVGAELTIVHKNLITGEITPARLSVTDRKNGLYIVSGLDLQRDGKWELSITVKKTGIEDLVKFILPDALIDRVPKGRYSP
jgi:hypothetical protein